MNRTVQTIVAGIFIGGATLTGFAQGTSTPRINHELRHQQHRINEGIEHGQLSPGEAARLEHREARVRTELRADRASGTVTPAERRQLRHQLHRDSNAIYRDRHNRR